MKDLKILPSIIPRETKNISRYFVDISASHPIEPEQEVELANRIHRGDIAARNELVTANLRFVVSVAKQYQCLGVPLDDLINEGNIGLIRAAEHFDPTRGFKFATFAVWWIRQAILGFISEKAQTVRLPQNVTNQLYRIRNVSNSFEQEYQRAPSVNELAQIMEISEDRMKDYLNHAYCSTSIDAPVSFDSDTTIGEVLADTSSNTTDKSLMDESLRHDLQTALSSIPLREQKVLSLYYGLDGEPLSMEMIAMVLHLSRERVRQLIEKATSAIRRTHGNALLQYYK